MIPPAQLMIAPVRGRDVAGKLKPIFPYPGVPNAYIDDSYRTTGDSSCQRECSSGEIKTYISIPRCAQCLYRLNSVLFL